MRRMFALAVLAACTSHAPAAPDAPPPFCTDQMPRAPTFTNVKLLFRDNCVFCHSAAELDLGATVAYANLVNKPPPNYASPMTDESCGGILVVPGDPATSYLYAKLSQAQPCAGGMMPASEFGMATPLPACELALVHDWIAAGAHDD